MNGDGEAGFGGPDDGAVAVDSEDASALVHLVRLLRSVSGGGGHCGIEFRPLSLSLSLSLCEREIKMEEISKNRESVK